MLERLDSESVLRDTPRPMRGRAALLLLASTALATIASAASAQTSASEATSVGEVVVTARRVEENIQRVPIAVTALSAEDVREKSITEPAEIQFHAPSVQSVTAFGRLSGAFFIRGLPGTTTYFAEVPGGPIEAGGSVYDVSSIQVLNGPQGTLFGRANTAGAVLITPSRPDMQTFDALVDVSFGNLGINQVTGVVNIPVVTDQLAIRLAVNRNHQDGYTRVLETGQRLNEINNESARIGIDWRPGNGRFRNYALLDYFNVDQAPGAWVLAAINPNLALFNLPPNITAPGGAATGAAIFGAACASAVAAGLQPNASTCIDQRLRTAATFKPALLAEYDRVTRGGDDALRFVPGANTNLIQEEMLRKYTFVNQTEFDFGDIGFTTATLRNIFGYQQTTGGSAWVPDGVGGLLQSVVAGVLATAFSTSGQQVGNRAVLNSGPEDKIYTNEVQLRGVTAGDFLQWNVGFYYQNNDLPKNPNGIRNLSRVLSGITLPTAGFNPSFNFINGGHVRQEALFGQGVVDLSRFVPAIAGLHFTGGIRRSWDKSEINQLLVTTNVATGQFVPGAALPTSTSSSSGWTSTLSLDAQLTERLLVYVARRTGYRPGGVNTNANAATFPNFKPTFEEESVKDIEIGAKFDFTVGDAVGRLNGALFKIDYTDIQRAFSGTVNGVTAVFTGNAAAAEIQGGELQGEIILGPWSVSGNYSYTDAEFTEWVASDPLSLIRPGNPQCLPQSTAGICLIDLSNAPFANIAKHQGTVTVKYQLPVDPSLGTMSVALATYFQSRRYFTDLAERIVAEYGEGARFSVSQPSFARFNLRADWNNVLGSDLSAAVFINNLTDETYALSSLVQLHSLGNGTKLYAEPRTYGLQLRYQFGR